MHFYGVNGGSTIGDIKETNIGITQNVWQHVAFVRSGSTPYFFINGVSQALTTTTAFGTMVDAISVLSIGRYKTDLTSQDFTGYMAELDKRISSI
jgi:hypothetical protein